MNQPNQQSYSDYVASLPKKRMGAGALFFDKQWRVLLVKPSYKPGWEIPGGVVEQDESPASCCQREVLEELGLNRPTGRLLIVDYNHPTETERGIKTESLMFIFFGGFLGDDELAQIQLPAKELTEYRFFRQNELPEMTDTLKRRVLVAWEQVGQGGALYTEEQEGPG